MRLGTVAETDALSSLLNQRRQMGCGLLRDAHDESDPPRISALLSKMPFAYMQAYANSKKVKIVGDMPIYVGGQSADVWAHQELFELTPSGAPANVSGVPPDAFSETGQLWGSPLYDWPVCAAIPTCSSHSLVHKLCLGAWAASALKTLLCNKSCMFQIIPSHYHHTNMACYACC